MKWYADPPQARCSDGGLRDRWGLDPAPRHPPTEIEPRLMWGTWASMPHVPPDWLIHHPMEALIGDATDVLTDLLQDDVAVLPQIDLRCTD